MESNYREGPSPVSPLTLAKMRKEAAEDARKVFLDSIHGQEITDNLRERIDEMNFITLEAEAAFYSLRAERGEPPSNEML